MQPSRRAGRAGGSSSTRRATAASTRTGAAREAAGYEALVLTVDARCTAHRDRERRAGFRLPPDGGGEPRRCATPARRGELCGGPAGPAPSWDDVAWLRAQTTLPLVLRRACCIPRTRSSRIAGRRCADRLQPRWPHLDTALPSVGAAAHRRCARERRCAAAAGRRRHPPRHRRVQGHRARCAQPCWWGRPIVAALAVMGPGRVMRCACCDELEIAMACRRSRHCRRRVARTARFEALGIAPGSALGAPQVTFER